MTGTTAASQQVADHNQVRLVGRVSGEPEERRLPSGDRVWAFRVVVAREQPHGRQRVDALECAAWSGRTQRSVARWSPGDLVEVEGALRRRFYRTGGGTQSRVEVEVAAARIIRRAATA
ncbi:single-stranded DNA-binding protein [Nocardioides coralli]|uniref:single-stranded DNA-binding protein n=1 Tax=Nocardioides coralli TaxID=2872154 RepID=UPI001CA3E66A|nr:single-stranded DNA-binding protein [Nocardioides coralli]QZY30570.1 single-stranded DNA-binding protein [Nocardioides coralli]